MHAPSMASATSSAIRRISARTLAWRCRSTRAPVPRSFQRTNSVSADHRKRKRAPDCSGALSFWPYLLLCTEVQRVRETRERRERRLRRRQRLESFRHLDVHLHVLVAVHTRTGRDEVTDDDVFL